VLFRLGVLMVRFRWLVIALWVVACLLAATAAPRVTSQLKSGFGEADTESRRALNLLAEELGVREATITVVFSHVSLRATDPRYRQAVEEALSGLAGLPEVEQVVTLYDSGNPALVSKDGHTSYAVVYLNVTVDEAMNLYPELRERLQSPEGFWVWATGGVAIFADLLDASEEAMRRAEIISFPLVLVASAFATSEIIVVKALGVGTAIAIFLDATAVRALLVPSLMRILGDWDWWAPRFLQRLLPVGRVV